MIRLVNGGSGGASFTTTFAHTGSSGGSLHTINHNLGTTNVQNELFFNDTIAGGMKKLSHQVIISSERYGYSPENNLTSNSITFTIYRFHPGPNYTNTFNITAIIKAL